MHFDRKKLFTLLTQRFGALDGVQQSVVAAMVDEFTRRKLTDVRWLAYILATGWGECRWRPVREIGRGRGKKYGKPHPKTGKIYYGRGCPTQLTWYENYLMMGETLNLPLATDPDLALQVPVGVAIAYEGMTTGVTAKDSFTKYQLQDFFNATVDDPVGARRIINGKDKAALFARWHYKILDALKATRLPDAAQKPDETATAPDTEMPGYRKPPSKRVTDVLIGAGGTVVVGGAAAQQHGLDWRLIVLVGGCVLGAALIAGLVWNMRKGK